MADTEKSEQPQTNGLENGLDEDERTKLRPADIDADVKEMERRKRVEMIMSSKLFREELERIIELQLKDGNGPAGLLQQISDMMGIQSGKLHTTHMFRGSNCVTPINDIRGVESMGYEKGEKNLRCKLASVFRLMDLYGWSQGINNQITARLNQDEEHFLVNPHGMLFNEITASSLVKVDMQGNIVEPGTTNFNVNTQGFLLHSAIHASRPDVKCVIHIKTPSVLAVSSLKCGLLPLCQEALVIGEVSQHPFLSGIFEPEEREKIIRNLGPSNKVLLLHNHGAVCCGATVEEAFYNVYNTVLACETQIKLMPIGVENLVLVNDETRKQVYDAAHRNPETSASGDKKPKQFRVGELEFEALIRMLDNAGFRTGYIYRHPLVKGELPKPKNDVEVPPAVSSLGYLIEQEELYKQGNWKKYIDGRNRLDRTKWLNSPNVYQKVEILETGTSDPKKITKWVDQNSEEWVAESSPTHSSTPVKIDSALQFVPKGTNPKEFKKLQQQIKENRRADKITSGPQSHILEGVSWEEAKKLQDANITQTGDQVILVGAASKGIIQRNYQHNALVYKTPYAKNPFDSMSDKEIEDYKQLVERKQRGDTDYEESQSESEAISSSRQDPLRHAKSPLLSPHSATSETEEDTRDEPRVLRIETKTAPRPIQAEVVLSDAESDSTDARVERSHSARYPKAEKPESVNLMNSFRKSWSLKREKDKSKDQIYPEDHDSRNLHPNLMFRESELNRMESLHCCVARIKQLTYKPIIVDITPKAYRPLLKSASDPCNLDRLSDGDNSHSSSTLISSNCENTSLSCNNVASDLQRRLSFRKKLIYSAKMKFLGMKSGGIEKAIGEQEGKEKLPTSPMCALISEIRETINEIVSPERSCQTVNTIDDYFSSLRWVERPKFVPKAGKVKDDYDLDDSKDIKKSPRMSLYGIKTNEPTNIETLSDFKKDFQALEKSDAEDNKELSEKFDDCDVQEMTPKPDLENLLVKETNGNEIKQSVAKNILMEILQKIDLSDDEATYTVLDDSLLPTYSFTETTETDWYYNKTIMELENSQTVLEIRETELQDGNVVKHTDTGIDTDFTSEKENENEIKEDSFTEKRVEEKTSNSEDAEAEIAFGESLVLNKSSETDSSFLKSSSGQTSNDVDTSFAFKTETENSDKTILKLKSFENSLINENAAKITDGGSKVLNEEKGEEAIGDNEKLKKVEVPKLPNIPESPEFTNIDTEDAPVTSSSKDTSPEIANKEHFFEEKAIAEQKKCDSDYSKIKSEPKQKADKKKRKKNKKSSTKITVKKEIKESDTIEPVVSEIKLTIKNSKKCQSEKYEVKIQDVTNTSEELSSSVGEHGESFEISDKVNGNCDCDAQQSLEELQDEVSTTIEKLQTIEDYFENEIIRHSSGERNVKLAGDELTIEYNYGEVEDMPNESRSFKNVILEKDVESTMEEEPYLNDTFENILSPILFENNDVSSAVHKTESNSADLPLATTVNRSVCNSDFDESILETIPQSIEENICEDTEFNLFEYEKLFQFEKADKKTDVEILVAELEPSSRLVIGDIEMNECLIKEPLENIESVKKSENNLQKSFDNNEGKPQEEVPEKYNFTNLQKQSLKINTEEEENNEKFATSLINNIIDKLIMEGFGKIINVSVNENFFNNNKGFDCFNALKTTETSNFSDKLCCELKSNFNEVQKALVLRKEVFSKRIFLNENFEASDFKIKFVPLLELFEKVMSVPIGYIESGQVLHGKISCGTREDNFSFVNNEDDLIFEEYLNMIWRKLWCPLRALTWPDSMKVQEKKGGDLKEKSVVPHLVESSIDFVLDEILKTVIAEESEACENETCETDYANVESSPSNSLTEFEDMENIVSTSNFVVSNIIDSIENQLESKMDDVPKETNDKELKVTESSSRKSKDSTFKVLIATPSKKEIFINYSQNTTSSFDLSSDIDFSNSYIKTDDVNEDYENFSSDNSGFFSVETSVKNSPNSSFGSIVDPNQNFHPGRDQFCCVDCDSGLTKSPRSLSIIQEVDEGENSASSEVCSVPSIGKDN